MPVTTTVYIHDQVDYRIVFAKCVELTGAPARTRTSDRGGMVSTGPGQGQRAWTWVEYGQDGPPLRTRTAAQRWAERHQHARSGETASGRDETRGIAGADRSASTDPAACRRQPER